MKIAICREEHFNAAHRLYNPEWNREKNREIFGKCSNENFHGHNYKLIVKVIGTPDPETGYVMDIKTLKDIIRKYIIKRFDHKNLNLDTEAFKEKNPTVEHLAIVIWNMLRGEINKKLDLKVILYETERNFVEYPCS